MKRILQIALALLLAVNMAACEAKQTASPQSTPVDEKMTAKGLEDSATSIDVQNSYQMENPPFLPTNEETPVPKLLTGETSLIKDVAVTKTKQQTELSAQDELRAVWISYLDFETLLKGKGKEQFTQNITAAFDNVKNLNLNTVIVQVRPYGDALYESDYFPWSYIVTGTEGKDPGFDPLEIMVEIAHEKDLAIEAWINPYRVRTKDSKEAISKSNPVHKMLQSGAAIQYSGGTYYNPASQNARTLIVNGVKEIVSNYNVDGIHFDDYFYPTTDAAFDSTYYASYKKNGGTQSLGDWRRNNVNQLVREVYSEIKKIDSKVAFGISPQGNMSNNYDSQFIDVALWLSKPGYVDYICPQIYFGFKNKSCPYEATVQAWNNQIKIDEVKLYVGLAPYKIGITDSWAGEGKYEWANSTTLLSEMVTSARNQEKYGGFILFRYDSVFYPASSVKQQVKTEVSNLKEVLK